MKIKVAKTGMLLLCSIFPAVLLTSFGYLGNNRAAALLTPGTWVAIQIHTPDIHGGARFIWTTLAATFLIYFVVFWSLLACLMSLNVARKNK